MTTCNAFCSSFKDWLQLHQPAEGFSRSFPYNSSSVHLGRLKPWRNPHWLVCPHFALGSTWEHQDTASSLSILSCELFYISSESEVSTNGLKIKRSALEKAASHRQPCVGAHAGSLASCQSGNRNLWFTIAKSAMWPAQISVEAAAQLNLTFSWMRPK